MSLTYTGTNGIFTQLGKLIQYYNQIKSDANDSSEGLKARTDGILDAFQDGGQDIPIDGLVSAFQRWKNDSGARREELAQFVVSRLQDEGSVLKELGVTSVDVSQILGELINEMDVDSESVQNSTATVGSVTAASGNQGGGLILVTDKLDGASSPGSFNGVRMPANPKYANETTELVGTETIRFRVTADSFQDGLDEGSEEITWQGDPAADPHGLDTGGSGYIGTMVPLHAVTDQYLSNADFESFTSNAPDDWTLDTGTAGTHILAETSNVNHGDSSLAMVGDNVLSEIKISQAIDPASVIANRIYCISVKMKTSGSAATSTVKLQLEGTGMTSSGITQLFSGISTSSFDEYHAFVIMPAIVPADLKLVASVSDTIVVPSNAKVYFDDIAFGPVSYGAGFGAVAVRESGPFVRCDRFEVSVSNSEGVFQKFFRTALGVQLPSSVTPTISDGLATTGS